METGSFIQEVHVYTVHIKGIVMFWGCVGIDVSGLLCMSLCLETFPGAYPSF